MAVNAQLQIKLAFIALIAIILNVCILIAIIAKCSQEEMCKIEAAEKLYQPTIDSFPHFAREALEGHPFILAFLIIPSRTFIGSAAIISNNWALTTAYNIEKASKYPLSAKGFRGGSYMWYKQGYYHYAKTIIPHPKYSSKTFDYNIALVSVKTPFIYKYEEAVHIPHQHYENPKVADLTGWGFMKKAQHISYIQIRTTSILPAKHCDTSFKKSAQPHKHASFTNKMLCVGDDNPEDRNNTCVFESGAPVVDNGYLIGMVSTRVECGKYNWPNVYINIGAFSEWINETIAVNAGR